MALRKMSFTLLWLYPRYPLDRRLGGHQTRCLDGLNKSKFLILPELHLLDHPD
jgi:hypothetical protein